MNPKDVAVRSGFAGAVALAAGSGAYGAIVTPALPANIPEPAPTVSNSSAWDVDGDSLVDFIFNFRYISASVPYWQSRVLTDPTDGEGVVGTGPAGLYNYFYGDNLAAGAVIGPASNFVPTGTDIQVVLASQFGTYLYGNFLAPNGRGFIGFKFNIGADTKYGWIELETGAPGTGIGIRFLGAGYEDSGASILAGQVPAPGTLAGLAFGAGALLRRKQRVA